MKRAMFGSGPRDPRAFAENAMSTIPIRDVFLHVKIMGQGDPLLLMHGGPGLDHTTLLSLEPLADRFTLIFYDHRGNGRSSGDVASMTWVNLTADADALRQTLGFDNWSILGHSFGGNVALEYALRYPERVSRLLLVDTCGDSWWYAVHAPRLLAKRGYGPDAVEAARRFFNGEATAKEAPRLVMKFMRAYFHHLGVLALPHAFLSARRITMKGEAMVFGFGHLLKGWTVLDSLNEIDVPTLVTSGRDDFLFPPEHQAILADRIPHAELQIIEKSGHLPQDEQPAELLAIITRFMAQSRLTASPLVAAE
jgi:proline iminopeptidase